MKTSLVLRGLRMHEDDQAKAFLNLGYVLGRFERLGESQTPPIFCPTEVWDAASKSVSDMTRKNLEIWVVTLAVLFVTTKELAELDGEELDRHNAVVFAEAFPMIGRDLEAEPLTDADRPRFDELVTAFNSGVATWTSQSWFDRAQQVPGEVRASSIFGFSTPQGVTFGHLGPGSAYVESKAAMTRFRMDGENATVEEIVVPGRFRNKHLDQLPPEHEDVIRNLLMFKTVTPPT